MGAGALRAVAALAARYGVLVLADEVHAPLTLPGASFTAFAPLAEAAGARCVALHSASKAWNLAGLKCALIVAGDEPVRAALDGCRWRPATAAAPRRDRLGGGVP